MATIVIYVVIFGVISTCVILWYIRIYVTKTGIQPTDIFLIVFAISFYSFCGIQYHVESKAKGARLNLDLKLINMFISNEEVTQCIK